MDIPRTAANRSRGLPSFAAIPGRSIIIPIPDTAMSLRFF